MNDPHVESLYYNIKHAEHVHYRGADPLEQEPGFTVRISGESAEIEMHEHFATADEARALVDPFLATWELSAALTERPDEFSFRYQRARIVDRNPPKGSVLYAEPAEMIMIAEDATFVVGRGKFPAAPVGLARDDTVDLMFMRYNWYFEGRAGLPEAAYFCFTMVLKAGGGSLSGAAPHFTTPFQNPY